MLVACALRLLNKVVGESWPLTDTFLSTIDESSLAFRLSTDRPVAVFLVVFT